MKKQGVVYLCVLLMLCGCEGEEELGRLTNEIVPTKCPDLSNIEALVNAVNNARSVPRMCGDVNFDAASPVKWNGKLFQAAQEHAADMAQNNFFSHVGSNGLNANDRVKNAGYSPSGTSGQNWWENIGGGYASLDEAMSGWLNSPGHCANIMRPSHKDYALACVDKRHTNLGTYWAQVFGSGEGTP
jgi:uncharacterized protein YkwD